MIGKIKKIKENKFHLVILSFIFLSFLSGAFAYFLSFHFKNFLPFILLFLFLVFIMSLFFRIIFAPLFTLHKGLISFIRGEHSERLPESKGIFGNLISLFNIMADEIQAYIFQLKDMAYKDSLTGTYNLLYLEEHADDIIKNIENEYAGIIMLDVDNFKELNDRYGHIAGDHYLRWLSFLIKKFFDKESYFAFRYGGDEFLIILGNSKEKIHLLAEDLRKKIENSFYKYNEHVEINQTISIGIVVTHKNHLKNFREILHSVDKALYEAKYLGKNRTVSYEK